MAPSTVQIFRAVPTANLFLLLPLTAATYHLPLPLTARPSVDCRDRYPTPNSNFTGAHRLVHPYGSPTILWLSMVLSLHGSLHLLAPHRGGRSVSAAPSSLPLFLHKAVVSRTLTYPFIRLWVFTLFTQSRHGSLSTSRDPEIIPRLLHASRSNRREQSNLPKYRELP